MGDEARVFLSIWRAWGPLGSRRQGLRPDHPARQWTGSTPEALSWFLREIVGSPDFRGLDLRLVPDHDAGDVGGDLAQVPAVPPGAVGHALDVEAQDVRGREHVPHHQVLRVDPPGEKVAGNNVITQPVPMPPSAPRKTTPRADKKPYSEENIAESQRGEKAETVVSASAAAVPAGSRVGATVTATDDEKLSWMWPSDGRIIATFDEGKNKGIDIAGRAGQQVMAAGAGKVMYAGSGIRGYGNLVIVKHSNSLLSAYAHNRAIVVKEGDNVTKGQVIAEMGDSDADTVKLHVEIRQQGKPVDPARFLPSR
jgi:lipoprotein NlpD